MDSTSRFRYFIVIDDELIEHLLQLPMPANRDVSIPAAYSVKVFDSTFGLPDKYFDGESDSDDDNDMLEEDNGGYEGCSWASARRLLYLCFVGSEEAAQEELCSGDDSWNGEARFVHSGTKLDILSLGR